jgi:hypothetical protein
MKRDPSAPAPIAVAAPLELLSPTEPELPPKNDQSGVPTPPSASVVEKTVSPPLTESVPIWEIFTPELIVVPAIACPLSAEHITVTVVVPTAVTT